MERQPRFTLGPCCNKDRRTESSLQTYGIMPLACHGRARAPQRVCVAFVRCSGALLAYYLFFSSSSSSSSLRCLGHALKGCIEEISSHHQRAAVRNTTYLTMLSWLVFLLAGVVARLVVWVWHIYRINVKAKSATDLLGVIVFGTQTGTASRFAFSLHALLAHRYHIQWKVVDAEDFSLENFDSADVLIFVMVGLDCLFAPSNQRSSSCL